MILRIFASSSSDLPASLIPDEAWKARVPAPTTALVSLARPGFALAAQTEILTRFGSARSCCSRPRSQNRHPLFQTIPRCISRFRSLAEASEQDVLRHWEGLGLLSQSRQLHPSRAVRRHALPVANSLGTPRCSVPCRESVGIPPVQCSRLRSATASQFWKPIPCGS